MTASKTYPVPENILQSTHLTASQYDEMYKQSVEQPEAFWAEHASMLEWYQKPTKQFLIAGITFHFDFSTLHIINLLIYSR